MNERLKTFEEKMKKELKKRIYSVKLILIKLKKLV